MAKPAKLIPEEESGDIRPTRSGLKKFDRSSLHKPQGPDSGINAVIGKWPGDDLSEEEFIALVEKIS